MIHIHMNGERPMSGRVSEKSAADAARALARATGRSSWLLVVGRSEVAVAIAPHKRAWEFVALAPRIGRVFHAGRQAEITILDAIMRAWAPAYDALMLKPWTKRRERADRALILAVIKVVERR